MTDDEYAQEWARKLLSARDALDVSRIANEISSLKWETGAPLTFDEKLIIVDKIRDAVASPPTRGGGKLILGGDNSRTLELIRAIRQLVK